MNMTSDAIRAQNFNEFQKKRKAEQQLHEQPDEPMTTPPYEEPVEEQYVEPQPAPVPVPQKKVIPERKIPVQTQQPNYAKPPAQTQQRQVQQVAPISRAPANQPVGTFTMVLEVTVQKVLNTNPAFNDPNAWNSSAKKTYGMG
jgi:hypothetical protein